MEAGLYRIAELSRRSGVSPELLRAWERRYTPFGSVADAARSSEPAFVVVSAVAGSSFRRHGEELARLAADHPVCVGGAGAADAGIDDIVTLVDSPVEEAERLTQLFRRKGRP